MMHETQIDKHKRALHSPSPQCQLHQIMAIVQTWLAATSLLGQVLPMPILLKKDLLSPLVLSQCPLYSKRIYSPPWSTPNAYHLILLRPFHPKEFIYFLFC